jgi:hypothetical protein
MTLEKDCVFKQVSVYDLAVRAFHASTGAGASSPLGLLDISNR